ncbi:NifU family protein [Eggerthia catenaformis]|uniref:NifU family protein n=1 Tax=Eggerthia catenaformis TaxID=31973 RepID=UPI003C6EFE48
MDNLISMEDQARTVISKIRPYLQRDGGDIEFVMLQDGVVYVQLFGACQGCGLVDVTIKDGVEQIMLEEVPGVVEVRVV